MTFLNDRYDGGPAADRNLHVDAIAWNGATSPVDKTQNRNGTAYYQVGAAGGGPAPLQLLLSEDAYQGDAQFSVAVDGRPVGGVQSVTAPHRQGQSQMFTFSGDFGAGPHAVAVTFLNDRYGGSSATDRNLYVDAIAWNGAVSLGHEQSGGGSAVYAIG